MDQSQYKIVVTGPYAAGKSTFVRALCGDAVSIDTRGTTVVMDYGQRRYQEIDVALFGTPGQSRFNFMIEILSKDADGYILVVDSSLPESWPYAISILNEVVKIGNKPCVVAANKQDLKDSWSPEKVKEKMSVTYPVIGTIAITGENVEKVLSTLMEKVEEL
jgi:hypothetical protein